MVEPFDVITHDGVGVMQCAFASGPRGLNTPLFEV